MAVQRFLRLLGSILFALTALSILALPAGTLPELVNLGLAACTVFVMLVLMLLSLLKEHSPRGLVHLLLYFALALLCCGWMGSEYVSNGVMAELKPGSEVVLSGQGLEGYTLRLENADSDKRSYDVVLTRPDQLSIHESIKLGKAMGSDGVEIHALASSGDTVTFYAQYDLFRYLVWLGGILFALALVLSAVPFVRKRGENKC